LIVITKKQKMKHQSKNNEHYDGVSSIVSDDTVFTPSTQVLQCCMDNTWNTSTNHQNSPPVLPKRRKSIQFLSSSSSSLSWKDPLQLLDQGINTESCHGGRPLSMDQPPKHPIRASHCHDSYTSFPRMACLRNPNRESDFCFPKETKETRRSMNNPYCISEHDSQLSKQKRYHGKEDNYENNVISIIATKWSSRYNKKWCYLSSTSASCLTKTSNEDNIYTMIGMEIVIVKHTSIPKES
jgi:hypothetical protein